MSDKANSFKKIFWPVLSGILAAILLISFVQTNLLQEGTEKQTATVSGPLGKLSFSAAVQASAPAVVKIYTRTTVIRHNNPLFEQSFARRFFGLPKIPKEQTLTGLGSGVIMAAEGYILTNYHVIKGADEILVELSDHRQSRAEIIGIDKETDLAVLKINLGNIPYIKEVNSNVSVGDIALAIGNPLGIGQTVTMGIVSATGRSNLGLSTYENFIQTDAAINKGNSGGALVDAEGKLIGINSVIFSQSGGSDGIGFAIPAKLALNVLDNILENGRVIRGWVGANFQKLNPELANYLGAQMNHGVVITRILKDGPAHKAGILPGDLITGIDNSKIIDEQDALAAIAKVSPGEKAELAVHRKGEDLSIPVVVGERP